MGFNSGFKGLRICQERGPACAYGCSSWPWQSEWVSSDWVIEKSQWCSLFGYCYDALCAVEHGGFKNDERWLMPHLYHATISELLKFLQHVKFHTYAATWRGQTVGRLNFVSSRKHFLSFRGFNRHNVRIWGNSNLHVVMGDTRHSTKFNVFVLYPNKCVRVQALFFPAITMHLDMLEEFLMSVLKEEGPNHT